MKNTIFDIKEKPTFKTTHSLQGNEQAECEIMNSQASNCCGILPIKTKLTCPLPLT